MEKLRTKFSVSTLLREMLLNDSTINELVGNQIYPIIAPEATQGNYIVYVRDEYSIERTKQGIYEQNCIVYISCVSDDYDISQAMADAVFQVLDNRYNIQNEKMSIRSINMTDSTEDYDGDVYIQTLQFTIK